MSPVEKKGKRSVKISTNTADTERRNDVASMSVRSHLDIMCILGLFVSNGTN